MSFVLTIADIARNLLRSAVVVMLVAHAGAAHAGTDQDLGWVLCSDDLSLTSTIVERVDERSIVVVNAYGIRRVIGLDRVRMLLREHPEQIHAWKDQEGPSPTTSPVRIITLSDGQRIRATLMESNDPDSISYQAIAGTSMHGAGKIPLDQIRSIRDQYAPIEDDATDLLDDRVITRTGDTIVGFVESISKHTTITSLDDRTSRIETALIESIGIANPHSDIPGVYLSLDDGEVLRSRSFDFDLKQPSMISVDLGSLGLGGSDRDRWVFDAQSITAMRVRSPSDRVVALALIVPERVEPTGNRPWTPSPVVLSQPGRDPILDTIDLRAPLRASYPLPEGASRFACEISAPIEQWTDCVIRVSTIGYDGQRELLLEQRLNSETPRVDFNQRLPRRASHLEFEIDPGVNGPIQDRVLIERPRLLIQN